jgi:hypothetical protein
LHSSVPVITVAVANQYVLYECVFSALVTPQAMRIRHIVLLPLACLALPYFARLSHTENDFRRVMGVTDHKMCFYFLHKTFDWKISHSAKNSSRSSRKVNFNETCIFSIDFRKILKYQLSGKSVQWGQSCCMRSEGWTDTAKLTLDFRNFCERAQKHTYPFTVIDTCLDLNLWSIHTKGRTAILQHMCILQNLAPSLLFSSYFLQIPHGLAIKTLTDTSATNSRTNISVTIRPKSRTQNKHNIWLPLTNFKKHFRWPFKIQPPSHPLL